MTSINVQCLQLVRKLSSEMLRPWGRDTSWGRFGNPRQALAKHGNEGVEDIEGRPDSFAVKPRNATLASPRSRIVNSMSSPNSSG